jgi:hypothetical protein
MRCPNCHSETGHHDWCRVPTPKVGLPLNPHELLDCLSELTSQYTLRGHAEVKVFPDPKNPDKAMQCPVSERHAAAVHNARKVLQRWGR